jgi:thiol-disulfide isomerase/thioredoxin
VIRLLAAAWIASVGAQAPQLKLTDLDGKPVTIAADRPTVILFVSTKCPVSNAYNERMIALHRDYSSRVNMVFVNSNDNEPPAEIRQHAAEVGFRFSVYKDPGNLTADAFGAQLTPEAFVVDKNGIVRYHGAIDDQRNLARVRVTGLRTALDAVLAGRPVELERTKAFGCTIKRSRRSL